MGNLLDRTIPGIARLISWLNAASQTPPPLINKLKKSGTYRIIELASKQTADLECEWTTLMMDSDDPWQQSKSWLDMLEKNPELAGSIVVYIRYGYALALFRLGQQQPANTYLQLAIGQSPRVARAILRKSMKQPKAMEPGYFTHGGEDEAWYYHQEARNLWLDTPGAMAWIKKGL